jgi:hypothetical protein
MLRFHLSRNEKERKIHTIDMSFVTLKEAENCSSSSLCILEMQSSTEGTKTVSDFLDWTFRWAELRQQLAIECLVARTQPEAHSKSPRHSKAVGLQCEQETPTTATSE